MGWRHLSRRAAAVQPSRKGAAETQLGVAEQRLWEFIPKILFSLLTEAEVIFFGGAKAFGAVAWGVLGCDQNRLCVRITCFPGGKSVNERMVMLPVWCSFSGDFTRVRLFDSGPSVNALSFPRI